MPGKIVNIVLRDDYDVSRVELDAEQGIAVHQHGTDSAGEFTVDRFDNWEPALGATHTGQGVGVRGTATYHAGSGVGGRNTANACLGVLGMGGSSQFLATGVYGRTGELEGGFGWAGYFDGDVMVGGDLYGGGKYCKIDHPLDPKNKYLIHACVESSERLNIYRGSVKLSTRGEATIRLPKWIQAFNSEFEYQLTPIGAAAPDLHVAKEITEVASTVEATVGHLGLTLESGRLLQARAHRATVD
jgi:hypothetical protein